MGRHLFLPIFVILMITSTFGENLESDIVDDYEPLNPFEENLESDIVDDDEPLNPFEVPLEETRGATNLPVSRYRMERLHNEWRRKATLMYKASNMKVMHWDSNLANSAQNYANKCIFAHNTHHGENLYKRESNNPKMDPEDLEKRAVDSWAKERIDGFVYHPANGHWTQMIWANTNKVGCGLAKCDAFGFNPYRKKYSYIMVCRYSPKGNGNGSTFEKGQPCSKCENGCNYFNFSGVLCK